jgi:hypothetical protein
LNSTCASRRVNTAAVALPSDLTLPNVTTPAISNCLTGPRVETPTRSPGLNPWSSAVVASIATCPLRWGNSPSLTSNGLSSATAGSLVSNPAPKVGPSCAPISLPSRPTSWALSVISPDATATSGTARTFATSDSGIGLRSLVPWLELGSNAVRAVTTASERS